MFLCEKCHGDCRGRILEPLSRGPCEECGKVGTCYDCHAYRAPAPASSPEPPPAGERWVARKGGMTAPSGETVPPHVMAQWVDEQGRRCSRLVADRLATYEQAQRIADAFNAPPAEPKESPANLDSPSPTPSALGSAAAPEPAGDPLRELERAIERLSEVDPPDEAVSAEVVEARTGVLAAFDAMRAAWEAREREARELAGLLNEWLKTPFFEDEADWESWLKRFRPRVVAALAAFDRAPGEAP